MSPLVAVGLIAVLAGSSLGVRRAAAQPDARTTEANITRLTTELLENSQFSHHPFDAQMADKFLDRYLDALDGSHALFLQSDVDEFAKYRPRLSAAMRETGDTTVAHVIFRRYLERHKEQVAFDQETLRTSTFDFSGHDVYTYDREHAPRPRDRAAAHELWRQQLRSEYLQEKLADKKPDQIASTLAKRHAQELNVMVGLSNEEVLDIYLNALAHVYDPHSDYMGREEMENFGIAMKLSLVGIGASLEAADGYCKIRELVPGGPAERGGVLKPGDRIVAVAQVGKEPVEITNMPLARAVELIRGPKGSSVTLTILPGSAAEGAPPIKVSLVRDDIKLADQEAKGRIVDLPDDHGAILRLGVIDLPSFYADAGDRAGAEGRSATRDVARLLRKMEREHVQGVVLDVRRNGGGSLEEAISLTGLFIAKGPVVQTRDQSGHVEVDADEDPSVLYDGPLVVLTSRFSASATEILAGALQDYGRAVLVGDPSTFGKGTVQNVLPLGRIMANVGLEHAFDPGSLKLTTMKFYRPSGTSTQLRGVASDIVLPSLTNFGDVSEASMKNPLPWDAVTPAEHAHLDLVEPYVTALRAKSAERTAHDPEFREVGDDMARLRRDVASKTISLNEAERRSELAQTKAQRHARDEEEKALQSARPTTYRVTLENASSPSLPAPEMAPSERDHDEAAIERSASETAILDESERILADYVELLRKPAGASARR